MRLLYEALLTGLHQDSGELSGLQITAKQSLADLECHDGDDPSHAQLN